MTLRPVKMLDFCLRIVGPATTIAVHCVTPPRVEVRTLGEAVSELGERLARVILTPAQLTLMNRLTCLPRVCLVGPPGTGKSLVLVLVGLHWLQAGHDVLVLSTALTSFAVSHVIHRQLEMTLREDPAPSAGTVHFLHREVQMGDERDVEAVVQSVADTTTKHILMDEAFFTNPEGHSLRQMVEELFRRVPDLCLWATSVFSINLPQGLHVEVLTVPVRSAPVIVREVGRAVDTYYSGHMHGYTASVIPSASDGPAIIRLRHEGGQHAGRWPLYCYQCGREVAQVLRHQLRVGVTGRVASGNTTTSPPTLQYRDVIVLTREPLLYDAARDNEGSAATPVSSLVTGLSDAGIPVSVITLNDVMDTTAKVIDLATARTDLVTVSNFSSTNGLERKVVVYLPGKEPGDERFGDSAIEAHDKVIAVSRCMSQLVMVDVPPAAVRELMRHQALMIRQFMAAYNRTIMNLVDEADSRAVN